MIVGLLKQNTYKMDLLILSILKHHKDIDTKQKHQKIYQVNQEKENYQLMQELYNVYQNLMVMIHQRNGNYQMVIYIILIQHQKRVIMLILFHMILFNIQIHKEIQQQKIMKFGKQLLFHRYQLTTLRKKETNKIILYNIHQLLDLIIITTQNHFGYTHGVT